MGNAKVPGSAREADLVRMMQTYGDQLEFDLPASMEELTLKPEDEERQDEVIVLR